MTCKKLDLSPTHYFAVQFFEVGAWFLKHTVCEIGIKLKTVTVYFFPYTHISVLIIGFIHDIYETCIRHVHFNWFLN
jgi:hypothetical protein